MLLRRVNGWNPMNRLQEEMERLWGQFGAEPVFGSAPGAFPALNVWEDDENIYAEAELPGLRLEDLELFVMGNELSIKGTRKFDEQPNTTVHRRERGTGSFSRVVRLPVEVDAQKVSANLRNGVLTVTLPKAPEAKPRKVEIQAQSR